MEEGKKLSKRLYLILILGFTLYQLFNDCATNSDFIAYNIDSIYIEKKDLPKIKMIFNDLELEYKLVLCQKIGLREYIYGNEKRIF